MKINSNKIIRSKLQLLLCICFLGMGISTVFGQTTNGTKIDSKTFVQIIDWAAKTGKPLPINGNMAKQMGLNDDGNNVAAIQKAYLVGGMTSFAIYVPSKDYQMDVVFSYHDPSNSVGWKVSRTGVVDQSYTVTNRVLTPVDFSIYATEYENFFKFFAERMNDQAKTNNVTNGNLQPPANK